MMLKILIAGILLLSFIGCVPPPSKEPFRREEPPPLTGKEDIFPLTDDGDKRSLQAAIDKSLSFLEQKIATAGTLPILPEPFGGLFTPQKTRRTLKLFREILVDAADPSEFETWILEKFFIIGRPNEDLEPPLMLTGYYEPVFEGSLEPRAEYRYPLYRRPDDLVEIRNEGSSAGSDGKKRIGRLEKGDWTPYYSRQEIDSHGVLQGKGYELVYLKDPWERFVLHVQGSGQIRLPEGKILRVGFAVSNGRPYRSIGQHLVKTGLFPEKDLSLRRVREFLNKHPEKAEEIFNLNERYVFFRSMPEGSGPFGALGVSLTEGRSIAADHTVYPQGALAFLVARQISADGGGKFRGKWALRRFVLNQDTGAAMKGSGRIDLFCGTGEKAGFMAGEMHDPGRLYFLLAK